MRFFEGYTVTKLLSNPFIKFGNNNINTCCVITRIPNFLIIFSYEILKYLFKPVISKFLKCKIRVINSIWNNFSLYILLLPINFSCWIYQIVKNRENISFIILFRTLCFESNIIVVLLQSYHLSLQGCSPLGIILCENNQLHLSATEKLSLTDNSSWG